MKKLIIASFVAASFAACNNAPKVEANPAVAAASAWVDSITNIATPTYDSATWANYSAAYATATGSIDTATLSADDKLAFAAAGNKWAGYATTFSEKVNAAKEDTTKVLAPVTPVITESAEKGK